MKYYSKTPEEFREFIKPKKRPHPFKNRAFLFIMADILIVFAMLVAADHFGFMEQDMMQTKNPPTINGVQVSGTLSNVRKQKAEPVLYINVVNQYEELKEFGNESGAMHAEGELEIHLKGTIAQRIPLSFTPKSLKPYEMGSYKFPLSFDESIRAQTAECLYRIRLHVGDQEYLLNFRGAEKLER